MGFFKESDWLEETDVVDTVTIARAIRENESVKNEIKNILNEEGESTMSDLLNRISSKIAEYKNEISYIDNQINSLYGRAFRNGENVDEGQVNKLENEMNGYKKKIELLEPIYEVLKEI